MIERQRWRGSLLCIGINRLLAKVTEVSVMCKNALIVYLSNGCIQYTRSTARIKTSCLFFMGVVVALSTFFPQFRVVRIRNASFSMPFHPLDLIGWFRAFDFSALAAFIQIIYPKLVIVDTSAYLALAESPHLPILVKVKFFKRSLVSTFRAYLRCDDRRTLRRMGGFLFATHFTCRSIAVMVRLHLMECCVRFLLFADNAILVSWLRLGELFVAVWSVGLIIMVQFSHDYSLPKGCSTGHTSCYQRDLWPFFISSYYTTNPPVEQAQGVYV
jgi:hypothetical protein